MHLSINEQEVSYSLETEKTLGEAATGVRAWLASAGFFVTGMSADGHDLLAANDDAWASEAISTVKVLDVRATHTGEMKLAHWRTVDAWLLMIEAEVVEAARGGGSALQDLLADLPRTMEGFRANPFLPPGSDLMKRFESLFADPAAPIVPARRAETLTVVRELRGWVRRRIAEATNSAETLARAAAQMRETVAALRDVSVLLQTGKDKAAMDIVIGFTDVTQSMIDVLPFCPPDPQRARLIAELTPILRDLVAAFDARDTVLIGDLLEYEIAPRVEKLAPLLKASA